MSPFVLKGADNIYMIAYLCVESLGICIRNNIGDSSVGKESACNAWDPGSIPGSGRSPGEGVGYPLQYSWASLVAQLVNNLPAVWETWVQSLGCRKIPWRKERLPTPVFWLGEFHGVHGLGSQRAGHDWATFTSAFPLITVGDSILSNDFSKSMKMIKVLLIMANYPDEYSNVEPALCL